MDFGPRHLPFGIGFTRTSPRMLICCYAQKVILWLSLKKSKSNKGFLIMDPSFRVVLVFWFCHGFKILIQLL